MVFAYEFFRYSGDLLHIASKAILIWSIHSNQSAEGVSLITQTLYMLVFGTRYLDIFTRQQWAADDGRHRWNIFGKLLYLSTSAYILFVMLFRFSRTREREKAWKFGAFCLGGAAVLTPFMYMIFESGAGALEFFWVFSEILESVAVLPQLLLLRQTTVPTVIDSFYLVALGSYRCMYILNWITRRITLGSSYSDPISWIFGTIQAALFLDFALTYWTRQRVKLRHGGIVDSEDLRRSIVVGRLIGRKSQDSDRDEEAAVGGGGGAPASANGRTGGPRWGRRGISVSADDTLHNGGAHKKHGNSNPETQPLADPGAFEDDEDDDSDHEEIRPEVLHNVGQDPSGVSNGSEWRDNSGK